MNINKQENNSLLKSKNNPLISKTVLKKIQIFLFFLSNISCASEKKRKSMFICLEKIKNLEKTFFEAKEKIWLKWYKWDYLFLWALQSRQKLATSTTKTIKPIHKKFLMKLKNDSKNWKKLWGKNLEILKILFLYQ